MDETEIYGTIGEAGFERLVGAFYRQVPGDDILGPMYPPEDLAGFARGRRIDAAPLLPGGSTIDDQSRVAT